MSPHQLIQASLIKSAAAEDSTFLGRYLASRVVPAAIMANKHKIMQELDPDGSYVRDHILLSSDMMNKQRAMAYDSVPDIKGRMTGGSYGKNALLGSILGGLLGTAIGAARGADAGGIGVAGLGGAAAGGLALTANHALSNYTARKVNEQDIARMKAKQRDIGYADLIPGRDLFDAATA